MSTGGRSLAESPTTGIPILDKIIGKMCHPANVARANDQYLPLIFSRKTAVADCDARKILSVTIITSGARDILTKAQSGHSRRVSELENAAAGIVSRAITAAAIAMAELSKSPNPKTEAAALDTQAHVSVAETTAAALNDEVAAIRAAFVTNPERITGLVAALRATVKEFRTSDFACAIPLALRASALVESLESGTAAAVTLADDFFEEKTSAPLPVNLIPAQWISRGCPNGFRWDGEWLVFA